MRLRTSSILGVLALSAAAALAGHKHTPQPVVWGVTSGNSGCVIFEEGHKYTGPMGIGGKTPVLRVIGSLNYTLTPSEWLESPQNLDALNARAQKDHLKLIKIPEKYAPRLLRQARAMCRSKQ